MKSNQSKDPQWDLAVEIAAKLWIDGEYVIQLDPLPTQRFVDVRWAAHQAGRVLGGRSKIQVSKPLGPRDPTVTLTVTYVDRDGQGLRRAEEGLEALLRMVLEEHAESG